MNSVQRVCVPFTLFASLLFVSTSSQAQLCFDIFDDLGEPTISCADASYFVNGANGSTETDFFGDGDNGLLGADFDGFDLFDPDEPDLAPPDNLLEPFFSAVTYNPTMNGNDVTEFNLQHRGSVSFTARDSQFQSASYGSRSRITFIPVTIDNSTAPIELELDFDFDFTLADPSDNATTGAALSGAGFELLLDGQTDPLFDFEGLAELDLDDIDEPQLFGDFDDLAMFEPAGPGIDDEFDIDIEFDTTIQATPGERLTLDVDTFGSIFTDGFESGDVSAWTAASPNTLVFAVRSSNPNVRFIIVTEGETQDINYGMVGGWFNAATSGQGFMIDIIPGSQFMFVPWFTFDTISPQGGGNITAAEQRWFTAQGTYSGNRAELVISQTRNGIFDDPAMVATEPIGTMVIEFSSCTTGTITYNIPSLGLSGTIPITKLLGDELCTTLSVTDIAESSKTTTPVLRHSRGGQPINYGLIGGWFDMLTSGQGFMFDFLPDSSFMFVTWFTFDTFSPQNTGTIPGGEQRWFTAQGNYSDSQANLVISQTRNGILDNPAAVSTVPVGTMVIDFTSCTTATITYEMPIFNLSGEISITKLLTDEFCTMGR